MDDLLKGPSYSQHLKPKKLIVMLHGYGDNADNFIYLANLLDTANWKATYLALNAPEVIKNYPSGYQWFDLYPNGVYISDAGLEEIKIIKESVLNNVKKIERTIKFYLDKLKLRSRDCILLGFSQGGIMTFELGNYYNEILGGLAILSGRIMEKNQIKNENLKKTPIFISHGSRDDVLPIKNFYNSTDYLKKNNCNFQSHELKDDTHTISTKAIDLLQKFIKKNL